jgi:hypothetical protein
LAVTHDPLDVLTPLTAVWLPTPFTVPHDFVAADAGAATKINAPAVARAALDLNTIPPKSDWTLPTLPQRG